MLVWPCSCLLGRRVPGLGEGAGGECEGPVIRRYCQGGRRKARRSSALVSAGRMLGGGAACRRALAPLPPPAHRPTHLATLNPRLQVDRGRRGGMVAKFFMVEAMLVDLSIRGEWAVLHDA